MYKLLEISQTEETKVVKQNCFSELSKDYSSVKRTMKESLA